MSNNTTKPHLAYHKRVKRVAKNLFIPNEANNHEPGFLRPKRLFLYASGSIVIKLVVFFLAVFIPLTAWLTPDIASEQTRKIIALTNDIRVNLHLVALKENSALSEAAYDKVQDMVIGQYFAHINSKDQGLKYWLGQINYNYISAGENLAMGFAEPQDVVNAWQASKTHYRNMINPAFTEIGVAMDSGKYEGYDTTFVAQYFALPIKTTARAKVNTPVTVGNNQPDELKSDSAISTSSIPEIITDSTVVNIASSTSNVSSSTTIKATSALANKPLKGVLGRVITKNTPIIASSSEKVLFVDSTIPVASTTNPVASTTNSTASTTASTTSVIAENTIKSNSINLAFINDDDNKGDQQKRVVRAVGYLTDGVVKASISFANYNLILQPDNLEKNKWSGSMIVFGADDKLFNPVVLPNLTVQFIDGSVKTEDINWSNIKPVNPSVLDRYFFIKGRNAPEFSKVFSFSILVYKVLLCLAIFSLLLNIFIKIKTQNYRLIAVSIGFIILMTILLLI